MNKEEKKDNEDEEEGAAEEEECAAEFKPVVQLEEVEVATGEEDEECLLDMYVCHFYHVLCYMDCSNSCSYMRTENASFIDLSAIVMSGRREESGRQRFFSTKRINDLDS